VPRVPLDVSVVLHRQTDLIPCPGTASPRLPAGSLLGWPSYVDGLLAVQSVPFQVCRGISSDGGQGQVSGARVKIGCVTRGLRSEVVFCPTTAVGGCSREVAGDGRIRCRQPDFPVGLGSVHAAAANAHETRNCPAEAEPCVAVCSGLKPATVTGPLTSRNTNPSRNPIRESSAAQGFDNGSVRGEVPLVRSRLRPGTIPLEKLGHRRRKAGFGLDSKLDRG
jgi:hypothetical protein